MENEEREYIVSKIKELAIEFKGTKFSYVYDKKYSQHIIEVLPISSYNDEAFLESQIKFEIELGNKFPESEIMFVTEGHNLNLPPFEHISLVKDHIIKDFESIYSILKAIDKIDFKIEKDLLKKYHSISVSQELINASYKDSFSVYGEFNPISVKLPKHLFKDYYGIIGNELVLEVKPIMIESNISEAGEENSYAMAA